MSKFSLPLEKRVLGPILRERASAHGDRPYLECEGQVYSFRQTDHLARSVARGMLERGTAKGDRVALLVPNGLEFVFSWYGCALIGAVMVPVNVNYKGALLEYVLRDCAPRGIVVDREYVAELGRIDPQVLAVTDWIAVIGGTDALELPAGAEQRFIDYRALIVDEGPDPEIELDYRDIHGVMYTSGTSGPSKGVVMPNAHFFSSGVTFLSTLGVHRDDVLFTNLPLFHGLASRLGVLPALLIGAKIVVARRFSASQFWKDVTEAQATIAHTIFTIPAHLKRLPPGPYDRAHRLRAMFNAPHDAEFEARFGVPLFESYGMTETGQVIYSSFEQRRAGASGKVHEDWEVRLFDDYDQPVATGQVGEIVVRPRVPFIMMQEYLNKPEETLVRMRNMWFHTGDFARQDEDGFFYFSGRKKEHIRRRGENISAFEVETVVCRHPDVVECAAMPYREVAGGEDDVRVVVALREGARLDAVRLMDWLQDEMPHFMLPRYVEFVPKLPRTPTDKVEKYKFIEQGLSADAWDREAAGYQTRRAGERPATQGAGA